ncbi:hypothetical protein EAG_12800 [Camponotus floridanus]|uniref:Uncharacterized protein n=1 Tax=Camponotus floridanus TaxID=104421 RepID=E2ASY0_CAMFO|nr:hypothetical protein EAG_12800 [Camponotus floridanus]
MDCALVYFLTDQKEITSVDQCKDKGLIMAYNYSKKQIELIYIYGAANQADNEIWSVLLAHGTSSISNQIYLQKFLGARCGNPHHLKKTRTKYVGRSSHSTKHLSKLGLISSKEFFNGSNSARILFGLILPDTQTIKRSEEVDTRLTDDSLKSLDARGIHAIDRSFWAVVLYAGPPNSDERKACRNHAGKLIRN